MPFSDKFREECGVFGFFSPAAIDGLSFIQFGLFSLQHRGQEAFGFSLLEEKAKISSFKKEGLVFDGFKLREEKQEEFKFYKANAGIGHTRYSTSGGQSKKNIQPLFAKDKKGEIFLSLAHNGNLVNARELRKTMEEEGTEFISDHSDTEVILRLIEKYFSFGIEEAIKKTIQLIKGAYSVVVLTKEALMAFRDPNGIRPLCYGIEEETGIHVFSSESCGLDAVGAKHLKDLLPGELVIINKQGVRFSMLSQKTKNRICSFEYIYFSRPDSTLENINIYKIREKSGEKLYHQHPIKADVVIGVPDSGVPAAIGFSKASTIPFKPILIKNKYIGRSFILPTQQMRQKAVNLKLNPIIGEIRGQRVVIVDDSIVRGTTSKRLVDILKKAGAKEIHFRVASPPIIAPCFLGVDTPEKKELISSHKKKDEIAAMLGVDSLEFLSMENLQEILGSKNHCFGCFTEKYPI